jgi:hypothetical protein
MNVPHRKIKLKKLAKTDEQLCDRLGGEPNAWGGKDRWPVCGGCKQPLHFVLQLLSRQHGGEVDLGKAAGLQLFVCHNDNDGDPCEFYQLGAKTNLVIRRKTLGTGLAHRPGGIKTEILDDPLRFAYKLVYSAGDDDPEALEDFDHPRRYNAAFERGFIDKLYGVPVGANDPKAVKCQKCRKPMTYLAQILSADEWFAYHLHMCSTCHEVAFQATRA